MAKDSAERTRSKIKKERRVRYKNDPFLKILGAHCRQLRKQRGYSIDRLAKEGDQLSPATIDRLEKGMSDSQILVLVRYAEALGLNLLDLLAFVKDQPDLSQDPRIIPYDAEVRAPNNYVPVYPIHVAAGIFSDEEIADSVIPIGWVDAHLKTKSEDYFATFVSGESMHPLIEDGDLCLFRKYTGGSRQGRIFLVQAKGVKNSETGESFVVKKYQRQSAPRSADDETPATIHLISINPRFSPIILVGVSDEDVRTTAEFVQTL
jgi:phage repressor protein C with HTH and peptisase S24 domain